MGPGKPLDDGSTLKLPVEIGAEVIYHRYGATQFSHLGSEYNIVRHQDVLGVVS